VKRRNFSPVHLKISHHERAGMAKRTEKMRRIWEKPHCPNKGGAVMSKMKYFSHLRARERLREDIEDSPRGVMLKQKTPLTRN